MQATLEPSKQLQPIPNHELNSGFVIDSDNTGSRAKSKLPYTRGLIPYKKGQSGNPTGRPKGFAELRHGILEFYNKSPKQAIKRLYDERIDLFFAYAFGKPADRVELSGPDGGAIEVQTTSQVQLIAQLSERGVVLPGME